MKNYGFNGKTAVVALGGNALDRKSEKGDIHTQFANTRKTAHSIIQLLLMGYRLVITHGNGPQVGDRLIQVEAAREQTPDIPLGVLVADTQGGIGYMIEQCIHNVMRRHYNIRLPYTATVLTQVLVRPDDPSMANPSKPIGPFYTAEEARRHMDDLGWIMKEDPKGRGWRRVVPSPVPYKIVETRTIKALLQGGFLVIAGGGGGIPSIREDDGWLEGVDAVVDKDLASAVLADTIGADELIILTDVEKVARDFNTPTQRFLGTTCVAELAALHAEGQFPAGSMGPKVTAAINFLRGGKGARRRALITSSDTLTEAMEGRTGTWIYP